ncbi:hypothetical protein GOP47_0021655 [Adiantum capillus-veneris]|uniref:Uncharacterized protein n=1 Tax=Adiantum capillus-veneris TaxID=13818 RepID=A0A9D4U8T7_ADICA|nr:hypothetical protein GOP47_0021655 [Adiantum capillus-veneris]
MHATLPVMLVSLQVLCLLLLMLMTSDDAPDAYSKYNVVFVDDQPLSHDEEASDRGSSQPAFMYRDVDIHDI